MKIHNSLTNSKEEFVPINENEVKMYACGITVYDHCHIGHARQALTYEVMTQYLRYRGYKVTYVRNYTDVDDKIIARANEQGINALEYSKSKIEEAEKDLASLNIIDADIKPKASEYIDKIINFVSGLIEKGYAYPTEKGDVYFAVKSFPGYGKLSNRNPDDMLNGVRIDLEEGKRDPIDFALWKSAKENEIYWESPWGKGRPGWHIECSAMALNTLGETIDIHGGGKDLVFPHHENEIAQSECLTGKKLANYWTHNGLIKVNGQKMSKSLGNSVTIKDLVAKFHAEVIRYTFLSKHYSTDLDLTDKEYALAEKQLYYFYNTLNNIDEYLKDKDIQYVEKETAKKIKDKFVEAMDDDFNTSAAMSELFGIFKNANNILVDKKKDGIEKIEELSQIKNATVEVFNVLGLFKTNPSEFIQKLRNKHLNILGMNEDEISNIIEERKQAKADKDYTKADELRNSLNEKGIILNDTKEGTTWDIKELYSISVDM